MDISIKTALKDLKKGKMVLLVDDVAPKKQAFLILPAESISEEDICFMVNYARGTIWAAIDENHLAYLGLGMMPLSDNSGAFDFTVSVEARKGVTTGISAADRAQTLRILATSMRPKQDLVTPGHIFPIRSRCGGVLVRNAPAEAANDLLNLISARPITAMAQCLNQHGDFIDEQHINQLLKDHKMHSVYISDIIRYRLSTEPIVELIAQAKLPTRNAGMFEAHCFRSLTDDAEHLALVRGVVKQDATDQGIILVRVQSETQYADLLGADSSYGRSRLKLAMEKIDKNGSGVLVYIRHPRKGTLSNEVAYSQESLTAAKKPAASPQARSVRTVKHDMNPQLREYGIGAQILNSLGVRRVKLLSNSSREITGLDAFHLEIVEREALSAD